MSIITAQELGEIHNRLKTKPIKTLEVRDITALLEALELCHTVLRDAAYNENYDADDAIQALRDTGWEEKDGKD